MNVDFLNIQYIFYKIYTFIVDINIEHIKEVVIYYWPLVTMISLAVSFFLVFLIAYLTIKLNQVKKMDEKIYGTVTIPDEDAGSEVKNERWLRVLEHLDSDSESEWRAAIMESDIILDEMTTKMGYHGDTLGEKLNSVEKSDFLTINKAWEAHKVRNIIAHEGSGYSLTKREAKRVIDLYRQVFEEFKFI